MKKTLLALTMTFMSLYSSASHLMGGQITARNIGGLTYEVTLTLYRDTLGIPMYTTANVEYFDSLSMPIMTRIVLVGAPTAIGNGVEKYAYVDTVTFPYAGEFHAQFSDCCRNAAIMNIGSGAGSGSLYLDNIIYADPSNSSPVFLNDPITVAQDSVPFSYNPSPFDIDGDSLSWVMDIPLDFVSGSSSGLPFPVYFLPPSDTANPFTLNPITGEITFTPIAIGNFQISVKAIEYRNGVAIGSIRRDMQLIVIPSPNTPIVVSATPNIYRVMPNANTTSAPTYVNPGQHLQFLFDAFNYDNGPIETTISGTAFLAATPAIITSNNPYSSFGFFTNTHTVIDWYPTQADVRSTPYNIIFRVADFYGPYKFYNDHTYAVYVTNSTTGIEDPSTSVNPATLVKTCDVIGREIPNETKGLVIRIYSDGSAKKVFVIED